LPDAVKRGLSLSELTIRGDSFGPIAAEKLAVSLTWPSPLLKLSLEYNQAFDNQSVRCLCSGLSINSSLTSLSLAYGGFGADGACALGKLLARSEFTALQHISLRGNYLGPEGLVALAPGIAGSSTLSSLDLTSTGIGRPILLRSAAHIQRAKNAIAWSWEKFIDALRSNQLNEKVLLDDVVRLERAVADFADLSRKQETASPTWFGEEEDSEVKTREEENDHDKGEIIKNCAALKRVFEFREAANRNRTRIKNIMLTQNNIMPEQGEKLANLFDELGKKAPLQQCSVDITLPENLYIKLWRDGTGGGKKSGKKGKKKK
jgi:hypothetical protein